MKRIPILVGSISAVCLSVCIAFAQDKAEPDSPDPRALIPVMTPTMDNPMFRITYMQDATSEGNIPELLHNSLMTIDGVEYKRYVVKFAGNPTLKPGQSHAMRIGTGSYLRGSERLGYSQETSRWRWKSLLAKGMHRVSLQLGGKEYGPTDFYWDGEQSMKLLEEKPTTSPESK
jgi:hypothetical protein